MKPHISYSQISLYDKCKFAYDLSYNKNLQQVPSSPLKKGSAVHKLIEKYQKICIDKKAKTSMVAAHQLIKQFRDNQIEFMGDENFFCLNEEELQDVFEMFDNFVDNFSLDFNHQKQIEVERKFALTTDLECVAWDDNNKDILFKGIIDLVYVSANHSVVITDYKSDRFIEPETVLVNNLQLKIYAYAMSLIYPDIKSFKVRYYYIRYNKYHEHEIHWADLEQVGFYLKQKHKTIKQTKIFEASLNKYCDWCGFKNVCPEIQKVKNLKLVDNDKGIPTDKLASELYALEILVNNRKEILKARLKQDQEFVNVGDMCLGFHTSTSKKVKPREAIEFLNSNKFQDYEIFEKITVSGTALKKIVGKDRMDLYKEMRDKGIIEEKSKINFQFKKIEV